MANQSNFNITAIIEKQLPQYLAKALDAVAEKMVKGLGDIIESEYYDQYSPMLYMRTGHFLNSATRSKIVVDGKNISITVYIDENAMDYEYVSGTYVAELASQGYHGSHAIQTSGRFWETFKQTYTPDVIESMIKAELKGMGLPIK